VCRVDLGTGYGDHWLGDRIAATYAGGRSCAWRDGVIAEQARTIDELTAANARLAERITQLERIVSRNSRNSSMLPSSDDLPGKTKPALRPVKGSGRRRGSRGARRVARCRGWPARMTMWRTARWFSPPAPGLRQGQPLHPKPSEQPHRPAARHRYADPCGSRIWHKSRSRYRNR
jgi:hypothetical protein